MPRTARTEERARRAGFARPAAAACRCSVSGPLERHCCRSRHQRYRWEPQTQAARAPTRCANGADLSAIGHPGTPTLMYPSRPDGPRVPFFRKVLGQPWALRPQTSASVHSEKRGKATRLSDSSSLLRTFSIRSKTPRLSPQGPPFGRRLGDDLPKPLASQCRRREKRAETRFPPGHPAMAGAGIEPATPRFSVVCSTN